jgi:hypothetical protein
MNVSMHVVELGLPVGKSSGEKRCCRWRAFGGRAAAATGARSGGGGWLR